MQDESFARELLKEDPFPEIFGQEKAKQGLRSTLLAGRNVLIIGPPGIGKTTLAKSVSRLLPENKRKKNVKGDKADEKAIKESSGTDDNSGTDDDSRFVRVQGSPDLTVEDLIGDIDPKKALEFGHQSVEAFTPGKIFRAHKGVLFFDEVNRCPEKVQNALLQVLEEGVATIGSYKVDFDADLILIATMNPEDSSTEKLSDVFLDRFDSIYMGYPDSLSIEKRIIKEKAFDDNIKIGDSLLDISLGFVRLLREHEKVEKKPSVRASLGLIERAIANAKLRGSAEASFDDVKDAVLSVIAHRIRLKPSHRFIQSTIDFVKEEFLSYASSHEESGDLGDGL